MYHYIMNQARFKRVLKMFKEKGIVAALKEFKQLHDKETFVPVRANTLTEKQKHNVLRGLMFLKEKHDMVIKGQYCADRRRQRL